MPNDEKKITLKPREERRVRGGHLWIFSNEIARMDEGIVAGDLVTVLDSRGGIVGYGYYSLNSLIAVRLLSKEAIPDMRVFLREAISKADRWKRSLIGGSSYRILFGESDGVPGLIIDRYETSFVIESLTYWGDLQIDSLIGILQDVYEPAYIVEKSESTWREIENLPKRRRVLFGDAPAGAVTIGGVDYRLELFEGQKTGFYLDQESNRMAIRKYAVVERVLDCFCNEGGFGLHAALAGAQSVTGVDSSESALRNAARNAAINGVAGRCTWITSDAFEFLAANDPQSTYDLIVLDPPSFVKSRKKLIPALKGYRKINAAALSRISDGGILATCSCSHHVSEELLIGVLHEAAVQANVILQILEKRGPAADHPILASMPETDYLHCIICRALRL